MSDRPEPRPYERPYFGQLFSAVQGAFTEYAWCTGLRIDPINPEAEEGAERGWNARLTSSFKPAAVGLSRGDVWTNEAQFWPVPEDEQEGVLGALLERMSSLEETCTSLAALIEAQEERLSVVEQRRR